MDGGLEEVEGHWAPDRLYMQHHFFLGDISVRRLTAYFHGVKTAEDYLRSNAAESPSLRRRLNKQQ